jgi:dephospho-CoA kinase
MSRSLPKNKVLRVGLTGGIGSGKSLVARIFKVLGVPVFNADDEAKKLYDHAEVRREVISLFGENAYTAEGLNTAFLASRVFDDQDLRGRLNSIIHPRVAEAFETFVQIHADQAYLLKEAAISFEVGADALMDFMILVTAPEALRIDRVVKRDHTDPDSVMKRMKTQWSDEKKASRAEFIIRNDEENPVIPAVLQIHHAILRHANTKP